MNVDSSPRSRPAPHRAPPRQAAGRPVPDAQRQDDMQAAARLLDELAARIEDAGVDAAGRGLATAVLARLDPVVREVLADEEAHLFPKLERDADAWMRQAVGRLRTDRAWLAANWRELRPLVDGVACGQSWVDPDALRGAARLFARLVREQVALEVAALARFAPPRDADAH